MEPAEYYAAVKALGLTPTKVPTVFRDAEGMTYNVPQPERLTPGLRREAIRRLREALGVEIRRKQ